MDSRVCFWEEIRVGGKSFQLNLFRLHRVVSCNGIGKLAFFILARKLVWSLFSRRNLSELELVYYKSLLLLLAR